MTMNFNGFLIKPEIKNIYIRNVGFYMKILYRKEPF